MATEPGLEPGSIDLPDASGPAGAASPGAGRLGPGVGPPGARPSFGEFYESAYAPMVRLAVLLTSAPDTAPDLVHDCFVKIHRHWRRIDDPKAYLRRSVVNACRSHHRRRYRERDRPPTEAPAPAELGADEMDDALRALPHRQRAALVLRFYHDLPDRDIAAALGCRVGTVASLVHRGLARLREVIEP